MTTGFRRPQTARFGHHGADRARGSPTTLTAPRPAVAANSGVALDRVRGNAATAVGFIGAFAIQVRGTDNFPIVVTGPICACAAASPPAGRPAVSAGPRKSGKS